VSFDEQLNVGGVDAAGDRERAAEVARRFGDAQWVCAPFFVAVRGDVPQVEPIRVVEAGDQVEKAPIACRCRYRRSGQSRYSRCRQPRRSVVDGHAVVHDADRRTSLSPC
jgi:hypothetical protein